MRVSSARLLSAATAVLSVTVAYVLVGTTSAQAGPLAKPVPIGSQPPPGVLWGQLWAWGDNSGYALGDGTTTNRHSPVHVPGMIHVVGAAPGIAVKDDGTVWVWGSDDWGALGNGPSRTSPAKTPVQVRGLTGVVAVASREQSRYALKSDGTLWDWGENNLATLGDGQDAPTDTPHQVQGVSNVTQVVAGEGFVYVREADGSIWGWGDMVMNAFQPFGDLIDPSTVPIRLDTRADDPFPAGVNSLGAGWFDAMGIHAGKVWTFGQDGDGSGDRPFSSAGEVAHITTATQVTAGGDAFYALLASGKLMAWGDNDEGELGTGSSSRRSGVPVAVKGLTHVTAMAGGMNAGYAIAGGTVYAWGDNYHGDLGDGTTTDRSSPVVVPGLFAPTLVAAGNDSAFAVAGYF